MNKQFFTILTDKVLYKCKEVYFTVCPAGQVANRTYSEVCEGRNIV
jgi:hypothetical protein